MARTPSSPSLSGFSEHEVPTRVRASTPWQSESAADKGDAEASGATEASRKALESDTTSVPVALLEAALAESRSGTRDEKSGARKRAAPREAFSVHEADTKKASTIEVRRALSSAADGTEVDRLLADVATSAALPAQPEPQPTLAPPAKRGLATKLAIVVALLLLVPFVALVGAGRGDPRTGYHVVRAKLAAR